jgi:DNA-binding CsgD family transcriptional regulator
MNKNITRRELEVIELTCKELTSKEIAEKLFISKRTVDNIKQALYFKLDLKNCVGLAIYAIKNGIYIP